MDISEFSEEILVRIVSQLSLREAVRTSVLSKPWVHIWTRIPDLDFSESHRDRRRRHIADGYSRKKWGSVDSYNYSNWVCEVLAQWSGSKVGEFSVCHYLDRRHRTRIDEWFQFAFSNGVETLQMELRNGFDHGMPHPQRCYTLQRTVFTASSNLIFEFLHTLTLGAMRMEDEVLEFLLSNCPLLEYLFLDHIFALRNVKIVGESLSLKSLQLYECQDIKVIEIRDVVNLVSFTHIPEDELPLVVMENAPGLIDASIDGRKMNVQDLFFKIPTSFSQLHKFFLAISLHEGVRLMDCVLPDLKSLKNFTLVACRFYKKSRLECLSLIKNLPNLKSFTLRIAYVRNHDHEGEGEWMSTEEEREAVKFCHPCLKVMWIDGYCKICDFELFNQVIENAVALKKIKISIAKSYTNNDDDDHDTNDDDDDHDDDNDDDADDEEEEDANHDADDEEEEDDKETDKLLVETEKSRVEQQLRAQLSHSVELVVKYS